MADESGLKHADITREVIGAAMEVHSQLGNGFQEVIYQRCLAIELKERGIEFLREQEMPLFYKSHEVGSRRADFVVQNKIIIELKAISTVTDVERAQLLNYLTAYRMEIGLLLNFGTPSLQFERFINSKFSPKSAKSINPLNPRSVSDDLKKSAKSINPVNPRSVPDDLKKSAKSINPVNPRSVPDVLKKSVQSINPVNPRF